LSIRGIAVKVGHHARTFHGLFTRMPIRKTTNEPSTSTVNRSGFTLRISPPVQCRFFG
jgi:hypothetical protein